MKKKKVNPARKPASERDVNKIISESARRMCLLFLYIMIDKHNETRDHVQELARQINYYADSIREGYISWDDIERTVEEEFDIKVVWMKGKKNGI